MKVSAIIPSYNRREALASCLSTLLDQDTRFALFEVVVIVDGSSDGTDEMLSGFSERRNLVVIKQENQGQTAALNTGVSAATGEIVLFLDDDLLCAPGLISAHASAHEDGIPVVVFGRMQSISGPASTLDDKVMHEGLKKYYSRLDGNGLPKWPDDAWVGPNCSLLRSTFLEAGGYDNKLFPRRGEDIDLGVRLWKMGVQFRYQPRAIASHRFVKSSRSRWVDAKETGASLVRLYRRYPEMRSQSALGGALNAPVWKRCIVRALISLPTVASLWLRLLVVICEKLTWMTWAQIIGMRLVSTSGNVATLAGARREAGSWRLLRELFRRPLAVLLYHHVGPPTRETTRLSLTIPPKKFARHIWWLHWRGYAAITPAQWLEWRLGGALLPKKPLILTFDDAYADITRHALPVLERHGFPCAIFVITGHIGGFTTWDNQPLMTSEQILHWASRGVEIGGHSRTHPNLTSITDELVADEVSGSKEDLVEAGLSPLSFAYPYGCFDSRVRKSVAGVFPLAFTCEEGLNDLGTDLLQLRRTMVQPGDTICDIELRAAFGWSPLNSLRSCVRLRSRVAKILRLLKVL